MLGWSILAMMLAFMKAPLLMTMSTHANNDDTINDLIIQKPSRKVEKLVNLHESAM